MITEVCGSWLSFRLFIRLCVPPVTQSCTEPAPRAQRKDLKDLCISVSPLRSLFLPSARLYEQGVNETRLGLYARRSWRWANNGVTLTDLTGLPPGADATTVLTIE